MFQLFLIFANFFLGSEHALVDYSDQPKLFFPLKKKRNVPFILVPLLNTVSCFNRPRLLGNSSKDLSN